jgi:Mycoplasma protein of unknown function, DUF285
MQGMFHSAQGFDANLSWWDAQDMSFMFNFATSYLGIGLEYWNTNSVYSMVAMFQDSLKCPRYDFNV